jgi:hypothetical protein
LLVAGVGAAGGGGWGVAGCCVVSGWGGGGWCWRWWAPPVCVRGAVSGSRWLSSSFSAGVRLCCTRPPRGFFPRARLLWVSFSSAPPPFFPFGSVLPPRLKKITYASTPKKIFPKKLPLCFGKGSEVLQLGILCKFSNLQSGTGAQDPGG